MFEEAIKDWLALITGGNIKQAPYTGPRPDSPYFTYQIINVSPMANGYKTTYNAMGSIDTRYTSALMTVSVNAYLDAGYAELSKVLAANDWWEARVILKDASMVFAQGSTINNLTALGDTDWRSRYQVDLTMHVDTTHDRVRYLIDQFNITGSWGDLAITTIAP